MSIPKTIHYCWFGRNPKPKLAEKCMKSWKKYCPDFEIIEWNEDNFDISTAPLYVRQAYEAKKWAFMTDYIRLKVVYDHGGVYLDTDVELKRPLDSLLENKAYFGLEDGKRVATGLGFGAEKGASILEELMADYLDAPFLLADGTYDRTPCPARNTEVFLRHGLLQSDCEQLLDGHIRILPSIYLSPLDYYSGKRRFSPKTVSIHWYSASWLTEREKKEHDQTVREQKKARLALLRYHTMVKLLGEVRYEKLKYLVKGLLGHADH